MNPCEISISVAAFANAFACGLNDDQLALAAATFTQLGDTLATILVARTLRQKYCCADSSDADKQAKDGAEKSNGDNGSDGNNNSSGDCKKRDNGEALC